MLKDDGLTIDARGPSGGGMLILQLVLMNTGEVWGSDQDRPRWLRACLATNREYALRHGHAMVLRWKPSEPQLTPWQWRQCQEHKMNESECTMRNERENFNWEKHLAMSEYLAAAADPGSEQTGGNFSHILVMDADAALVRQGMDTLGGMARTLAGEGKDVLLADEDWLKNGKGRINGGLLFANTGAGAVKSAFARQLFRGTFDAHVAGPDNNATLPWEIGVKGMTCNSNEQLCLNALWHGQDHQDHFRPHVHLASGNR